MLIISHRGNLYGPTSHHLENHPDRIDKAIELDFHVEVDVWGDNSFDNIQLALGHDEPQHPIDKQWIMDRSNVLWFHCKNFSALSFFTQYFFNSSRIKYFYHNNDNYTLVSSGDVWMYPKLGNSYNYHTILACPEMAGILKPQDLNPGDIYIGGVCTDYPMKWQELIEAQEAQETLEKAVNEWQVGKE